ncbi:hypothetical protein WA158_000321 [Blastocystis sp. Blastoise]
MSNQTISYEERKRILRSISASIQHNFSRPQNVGILAMDCYIPPYTVKQSEYEVYKQCEGKYTKGLGQERIAFCGDNEDAVSMAMTCLTRMMKKYNIRYQDIGRLEVGTESMPDRSKSIKTYLMSLFEKEGNTNIEGVDVYTACYGGTAALLNSISWIESSAWDGRYALVIACDIAELQETFRFMNGSACICMLIGPNAPLSIESTRYSYMNSTWDFYKPVGWHEAAPVFNGPISVDCYQNAITSCIRGFKAKQSQQGIQDLLLNQFDYFIFHCTSVYLIKRGFNLLCKEEQSTLNLKEKQQMFTKKVEPSTLACKQIGSGYTAAVYVNLLSLLSSEQSNLIGKKILMYSYGSGCSSTMYSIKVNSLPLFTNILSYLDTNHIDITVPEFNTLCSLHEKQYGQFPFYPQFNGPKIANTFYLDHIDEEGKRYYEEYQK